LVAGLLRPRPSLKQIEQSSSSGKFRERHNKHLANQLLSMNNYTPLVISKNDKNKQLTLLSQRKLALTAVNELLAVKNYRSP
jgi:hypothetical protein